MPISGRCHRCRVNEHGRCQCVEPRANARLGVQSHHQLAAPIRLALRAWPGRLALVAASVVTLAGCGDVSHMFGGMWKSEAALSASFITGRPELAIGHFGREMTGIVRFLDEDAIVEQECGCAYLDQQDVDLDNQHFIATTTLCAEADEDPVILIWDLTYDDGGADPRLFGEVRVANDDITTPVPVSFRLDDRFVPDDKHVACDP